MDTRRTAAPAALAALFTTCLAIPALAQHPSAAPTKPHSTAAAATDSAAVVATVNGKPITRGEVLHNLLGFETAWIEATNPRMVQSARQQRPAGASISYSIGTLVLERMQANGGQPVTLTRQDISNWLFKDKPPILAQWVGQMIQQNAIQQDARAKGVAVTPTEIQKRVQEQLESARRQLQIATASDAQVYKAVGRSPEWLRDQVRTSLLLEKLVERDRQAKLGHPLGPNDFMDASQILVAVHENDPAKKDQAWADALKKIQGIQEEIKSGKISFEEAAEKYSDDPSKFRKGEMGLFMRGQMVSDFENAAWSQEPGKVGEPVKTQFGYHLIRVNRLGKDTTGPERENLQKQDLQRRMQLYMQDLMTRTKVTNTLAEAQPNPFGGPGAPGPRPTAPH